MIRNMAGSIYGRSSVKIANLVPIHKQTWPPQAVLVSDRSISENLLLWNRFAKWTEICILSVLCLTEIFEVFANSVWQPFLLTDHDKISNLYRVPSINVSYKVSKKLVVLQFVKLLTLGHIHYLGETGTSTATIKPENKQLKTSFICIIFYSSAAFFLFVSSGRNLHSVSPMSDRKFEVFANSDILHYTKQSLDLSI
jgi:hypothetical protein